MIVNFYVVFFIPLFYIEALNIHEKNFGRYRFVECAALDGSGVPLGDITAYGDVLFPFDRGVRSAGDLTSVPVRRMPQEGPLIQEEYAITPHGIVQVTITDLDNGFARAYAVGA